MNLNVQSSILKKVSEVYYYMKQSYFSLNYAKRAIKIYRKYNIDDERILHCRFIVAGNLIDTLNYENAIHELEGCGMRNVLVRSI